MRIIMPQINIHNIQPPKCNTGFRFRDYFDNWKSAVGPQMSEYFFLTVELMCYLTSAVKYSRIAAL